MKVYIVQVIPEASLGKVSQEGYSTLEKAQAFVESRRSAEHFSKCFEVKKLFDLCYDETHCMLFDADFSPWADYLKAVNRKDTKRALDKELHNCYRFLANELNAIAALMRAGEVDSID